LVFVSIELQLCKFLERTENAHWASPEFAPSQPEMMTALKRKQELREKVDVNFDGRVSMLEYLLYQYQAFANPADFCSRSMVRPNFCNNKKRMMMKELA
jgi:hypothetical protein